MAIQFLRITDSLSKLGMGLEPAASALTDTKNLSCITIESHTKNNSSPLFLGFSFVKSLPVCSDVTDF
jgi:hypothetical protein